MKGYHSVQALYGKDRLTKAQVRKNGSMVEVPIQEALDLVAQKLKETRDKHGKDSVAMYGSGQWTIPDGYVASKLFKGCLGTNNVEANARLCMASAVRLSQMPTASSRSTRAVFFRRAASITASSNSPMIKS